MSDQAIVPFSYSSPFHNSLSEKKRHFQIQQHVVNIHQEWKDDGKGGTELGFGASVYHASIALSLYLQENKKIVVDQRIIELGCGTGLVSITAALLGAKYVYATDGDPSVVNLAQKNIDSAPVSEKTISSGKYLWGEKPSPSGSFDVILACDVVACPYVSSFDNLLKAFQDLSHSSTNIFLAYKKRNICESSFFVELCQHGFEFNEISQEDIHADFEGLDIHIYHIYRKQAIK